MTIVKDLQKSSSARKSTLKSAAILVISAPLAVLLLINAAEAAELVRGGLKICAVSVIPALFPFMVFSSIASGVHPPLRRYGRAGGKLTVLPGVSVGGALPLALGLLCGTPSGTTCAVRSLENGSISDTECSCILAYSNSPSPAFVLGAVSAALGGRKYGAILLCLTLLSSLICGAFSVRLCGMRSKSASHSQVIVGGSIGLSTIIVRAVTSAAIAMLNVCAFVVLFSVVIGMLCLVLDATPFVRTALSCFFELSSGVLASSALRDRAAFVCTAATLGWSGVCVHCQVASICQGRGITLRPYFVSKLLQTLFNTVAALVLTSPRLGLI